MRHRLVESAVEHVGGGQGGEQPGAHAVGVGVDRRPVEPGRRRDLLERAAKALRTGFQVIAEQVPGSDERADDRGRGEGLAGGMVGLPRRFERVGRALVVVRRSGIRSEALEDPGARRRVKVRRRRAKRARVELAGLGVRGQGGRRVRGCHGRPERVLALAGPFEMEGQEGTSPEFRAIARGVGGPGVQPSPIRLGDPGIDRVADQRVAKAVAAGNAGGQEDEVIGQLAERPRELGGVLAGHAGQEIEVEGAPDDRPRLGDARRVRGPVLEPRKDRIFDGLGNLGGADGLRAHTGRRRQQAEQLLDVERDPICPRMDRIHDVAGGRQPGADEQGRHRRRIRRGEPGQPHLLRLPAAEEPRTPLPHRGAGEELVATVRPDDQEPSVRDATGERLEDLEGQVVGPLEVLQGDHRRGLGRRPGEELGDIEHEHATAPLRVGDLLVRIVLEALGEPRSQRREVGLALEGAGEVDEDRARHLQVARVGPAADRPETGGRRTPLDRPQQPCLAHAGFAREQQESPAVGGHLRDPTVGKVEEVVAAHEDRADKRSRVGHGGSLGDGRAGSSVT